MLFRSDKHKDESNVLFCQKCIKKYFQYEKNTYRWVHLSESDAVKLEKNGKGKLFENTYTEFTHNNKKMREYHIDTHSIFQLLPTKKIIHKSRLHPHQVADAHWAGQNYLQTLFVLPEVLGKA